MSTMPTVFVTVLLAARDVAHPGSSCSRVSPEAGTIRVGEAGALGADTGREVHHAGGVGSLAVRPVRWTTAEPPGSVHC